MTFRVVPVPPSTREGDKLRNLRRAAGMSIPDLALFLPMPVMDLCRVEHHKATFLEPNALERIRHRLEDRARKLEEANQRANTKEGDA